MSTPTILSATGPGWVPGPPLPPAGKPTGVPSITYYIFTATGATQWEFPGAQPPQSPFSPISPALDKQTPTTAEQSLVPEQESATPNQEESFPFPGQQTFPPDQPQYDPALQGAGPPVQTGERGLGTTALALGGGFLAGSALGHKSDGGGVGFGKMAASFAAGAIGTKMFGFLKNKPQTQAMPPPQSQHQMQPQVHVYPAYVPGPPGPPPPGLIAQSYGSPSGPPPSGPMTPPHGPPPTYQGYGHSPSPISQNLGYPHSLNLSSPPSVQSPAIPAMASVPPPSGPQLHIHGAAFADKNVTDIVRGMVATQQELSLKGESLVEKLGDPWPEVPRKTFSVLYSYGERPMELLVASTSKANIEIRNEAISKTRMDFCHPTPSRIAACAWGVENPLTAPRLEQLEKDGEMEGETTKLGAGGLYPWEPRTLVCYYRTESGSIDIKFCREGGTLRLPWNPLAKWS